MNTVPSTSTNPVVSPLLSAAEQPVAQVSENVATITNSTESLTSFERILKQTFPDEILLKIVRGLHPTRQVNHPWQNFMPEPYSRLLDCSATQTNAENAQTLLDMLTEIPNEWQQDAINAISENFIKRIQHFDTFIVFIYFILSDKKSDGNSMGGIILNLIECIGRLSVFDMTFRSEKKLLPENLANFENHCINKTITQLRREQIIINLDTKLQQAKNLLFFHKVRESHWDINNACGENKNTPLKERIKKASELAGTRLITLVLKISQKREALLATQCNSDRMEQRLNESRIALAEIITSINKKIKTFNDNQSHHARLINRHSFEILSDLIEKNIDKMPDDIRKKIQLKLASSIGELPKQQRHTALYALIQSKNSNPLVLSVLIDMTRDDFYQYTGDAIRLIANKIKMHFDNESDLLPVISVLKKLNNMEPPNIWWQNIHILPTGCQELLRGAAGD
ncbi:hypothetical protein [Pantoea cypripedii]|uniref:Uncharacterized protein n=1 Tax=Pantoea cypripedii TaxID=55209 RepID=A0A6B9G7F3_PANCY|nr:hypothetical protein [Pantoea cypripedii]QGY31703.1 hypothetical protein CUN67_22230 [Pantoea cypripedii]